MFVNDTIAAISSAAGPAARMIVRLSGPGAESIAAGLGAPAIEGAARRTLHFASLDCPAWVYYFVAPRSYTGQDLIELHIPGNPRLARMLMDHLLACGTRAAEPGEFTARAFFNGKMDLSQAEGVAAAIGAQNHHQLAAARQLLAGELSRRLRPAMESLADTLALVEAGIDFAEEDIEFLSAQEVKDRIATIVSDLESLIAQSSRFEKLTHEPAIVLAGRPNAGKSTLVNALAGFGRSIVSPQPGTTRDALSMEVSLPRGIARLIDIAGLEEQSGSYIETQMQDRARRAIEESDVLVLVRDSTDGRPDFPLPRAADLRIESKADLQKRDVASKGSVLISAVTGTGMEELREALDRLAFGSDSGGAALALTSRHLHFLHEALAALERAADRVRSAEILAAELRAALDALGQILGDVTPDDILGKIFATFCMGK